MMFSLAMIVGLEICHFEVFSLEIHSSDDLSDLLVFLNSTRCFINGALEKSIQYYHCIATSV